MGLRIIIQPLKAFSEPSRNMRGRPRTEVFHLLEIMNWQYTRHDWDVNASTAHTFDIALEKLVIKEELRNGTGCTIIDLALEHIDVGCKVRAFRVLLRISGNRNVEIIDLAQSGHQLSAALISSGRRDIFFADTCCGVPT